VKIWARACAVFHRLPEMVRDIRRLRKEINTIKSELQQEKME